MTRCQRLYSVPRREAVQYQRCMSATVLVSDPSAPGAFGVGLACVSVSGSGIGDGAQAGQYILARTEPECLRTSSVHNIDDED